MKFDKTRKKSSQDDEGLSDEEFIAYFKKCEEEIEKYIQKNNIIPPTLTPIQKLKSQIAKLSVLYVDSNKDKMYGIEAAECLIRLKELCAGHDYLIFLNYILEENLIGDHE